MGPMVTFQWPHEPGPGLKQDSVLRGMAGEPPNPMSDVSYNKVSESNTLSICSVDKEVTSLETNIFNLCSSSVKLGSPPAY